MAVMPSVPPTCGIKDAAASYSTHGNRRNAVALLAGVPPTWVMEGYGAGQHYFGALDTRVKVVVHAAITAEWSCRGAMQKV